jgi:hypothetical protein
MGLGTFDYNRTYAEGRFHLRQHGTFVYGVLFFAQQGEK